MNQYKTRNNTLCKQDMEHLKEVFAALDRNGDGNIDVHELNRATRNQMSRTELIKLMKSVDQDGDMRINFDEFVDFMCAQHYSSSPRISELMDIFAEIDVDKSGTLDKRELKMLMIKFGQPLSDFELNCIMQEADKDGDGVINLEEFLALMGQ